MYFKIIFFESQIKYNRKGILTIIEADVTFLFAVSPLIKKVLEKSYVVICNKLMYWDKLAEISTKSAKDIM